MRLIARPLGAVLTVLGAALGLALGLVLTAAAFVLGLLLLPVLLPRRTRNELGEPGPVYQRLYHLGGGWRLIYGSVIEWSDGTVEVLREGILEGPRGHWWPQGQRLSRRERVEWAEDN